MNQADWNHLIAGNSSDPIAKKRLLVRLYSPLRLLRNLEYQIRGRRRRHHTEAGVADDGSFVALIDVAELEVAAEPFVSVLGMSAGYFQEQLSGGARAEYDILRRVRTVARGSRDSPGAERRHTAARRSGVEDERTRKVSAACGWSCGLGRGKALLAIPAASMAQAHRTFNLPV